MAARRGDPSQRSARPQFATVGNAPELPPGSEPVPPAEDFLDTAELPAGTDPDIRDVLDELGADRVSFVRSYHWGRAPGSNEEGWLRCGKTAASEFDPDGTAARFGPGKYRFDVIGLHPPTGRHVVLRQVKMLFAAPASSPALAPPTPGPAATAAGAAPTLAESLMLQFLQHQQQITIAAIQSLGRGAGGGAAELMQMFKAGLDSTAQANPTADVIKAVSTGFEFARQLAGGAPAGGADVEGAEMGPLERLAPKILDVLTRALDRPAAARGASAAPPAVALPPTLRSLAARYAPLLLREAREGRDPQTWGAFIAERCPDTWLPALGRIAAATPAARMQLLTAILPELAAYTDWITQACEGIQDVVTEGEIEDADAGDAGGGVDATAGRDGNLADGSGVGGPDPLAGGTPAHKGGRGGAGKGHRAT